MFKRVALLLDSIKFAHSVFALPFALIAMIVAAGGWPDWRTAGLIAGCMVAARTAAMAFNRYVDRDLDRDNPRTRTRPSVTGAISPGAMLAFFSASAALYWLLTYCLNRICFALALPVLAILLGYSFSKRFTYLCHFWLGFALGLAPLAAHLAVRGELAALPGLGQRWHLSFEAFPLLLGLVVLCWVSGFDLIYACQDRESDERDPRVNSIPKRFGAAAALRLARGLHVAAVLLLAAAGAYAGMGLWYAAAVALVAVLLAYEHAIVSPADLSRVNVAFFTVNGAVSLVLLAAVILERVLWR
jgi:4-hydroxybenzoate polyprenyltransferase